MTRNAAKLWAAGNKGAASSSAWHVAAKQIEGLVISLENTGENYIKGWEKGRRSILPCHQTVGSLGQGFCSEFAQQGWQGG